MFEDIFELLIGAYTLHKTGDTKGAVKYVITSVGELAVDWYFGGKLTEALNTETPAMTDPSLVSLCEECEECCKQKDAAGFMNKLGSRFNLDKWKERRQQLLDEGKSPEEVKTIIKQEVKNDPATSGMSPLALLSIFSILFRIF